MSTTSLLAFCEGNVVVENQIEIVDRGRGMQLSSCRITVQDVVPYIQMGWSHEQIKEIMPILTDEEIAVIERYVKENREEVMEEDRRIRERTASQRNPLEVEKILREARIERLAWVEARRQQRSGGKNGEGHPR